MPRRRGQVMVLFVAMLPVLFGFLGMALDGGWYFALKRGAQFAASAAARAAAQEVQAGRYSNAVPWGQTVGLYDLRGYRLTGPAVALDFNDASDATPTSPGWGAAAQASSTSVRATVTASYPTLLMGFVGVRSLDLQRQTVVSIIGSGGPLPPVIAPIAICQSVSAAMDANPTVPQTVWALKQNPCGVTNWDGLIAIGAKDDCAHYQQLLQPAPSGTPQPIGTSVGLSQADCKDVDKWMNAYTNKIVWVGVVAVNPTTRVGTILCYRQVQINASTKDLVTGIPTGEPPICGGVRETY